MPDTKPLIERAGRDAPPASFSLDDIRRRRDRAQRRRRLASGIVAGGVTLAVVAFVLVAFGPLGDVERVQVPHGGIGLPPATKDPVTVAPNAYTYQHLVLSDSYQCASPDQSEGPDTQLDMQSWWRADGSGRIAVDTKQNYGIHAGTFGPGEFHTEGDLSEFPLGTDALRAFLLDRSGADGASPRPDVTPSPGVPLEEGLLWNSIQDYLGSTQYLNTTPALRASMLEVLATVPMVNVDLQARDPAGREAIALRFTAYAQDVVVFVDPATHDFLGMTEVYPEDGSTGTVLVVSAGAATTTDAAPTGSDRSVPTAS
jgi:hypothetical protein